MCKRLMIRVGIATLLLAALLIALAPGIIRIGEPNAGAVLLAQDSQEQEPEDRDEEDNEKDRDDGDAATQNDDGAPSYEYLTVEVVENGYEQLWFSKEPAFEDGSPGAYGSQFITQGYIYPEGTVTCGDDGCNGIQDDGSPEFPDKVIGEWTMYGYHVGEGARTASGPAEINIQYFKFGDGPEAEAIVTHGFALLEENVPTVRPIIGGSGAYRYARGEQEQELLDFALPRGATLRATFTMRSW